MSLLWLDVRWDRSTVLLTCTDGDSVIEWIDGWIVAWLAAWIDG